MEADREAIRRFVLRYFELLGADIERVTGDVYRAELDQEQARELEGGQSGFWMGTSDPNQRSSYYFTFTPEVAERTAEVELVGPGSHRLQQVIQSVRRLAQATRVWLPLDRCTGAVVHAGESVTYRPFYLFCFRLDFQGSPAPSRLIRVAVDRVDQLALRQLPGLIPRLPLLPGTPKPDASIAPERAFMSFDTAFALAFDDIMEQLGEWDPEWATQAMQATEDERERLVTFFAQRERDGDDGLSDERTHRLEELDQMLPRVLVRIQGVTEAHLPVSLGDGSVRHLVFTIVGSPAPDLLRN